MSRWAEPEIEIAEQIRRRYDHVLVVPCFDETVEHLRNIWRGPNPNTLVILVVNAPLGCDADALTRTRKLLHHLIEDSHALTLDHLVVDRCSPGREIPRKQGVGLARKIGGDVALALIAKGYIRTGWLYFTDADAMLPSTYFSTPLPDAAAVVLPFKHVAEDPSTAEFIRDYEWHMTYYVSGLCYAGSPYAYHSLGSTLVINPLAYAQVRGVPKRNAGEDFHVLSKLAKTGAIVCLPAPVLTLSARTSSRTPFGTGPHLQNRQANIGELMSYPWGIFELLKHVIETLNRSANEPGLPTFELQAQTLLEELGFFAFFAHAQSQHRSAKTLTKALHQWFDALKTLRFVHLAERYFPSIPLHETLAQRFPTATLASYGQHLQQNVPLPRVMGIT